MDALLEEEMFMLIHMKVDKFKSQKLPIHERKYQIYKYIEYKQKEKEEIEKQSKKGRR